MPTLGGFGMEMDLNYWFLWPPIRMDNDPARIWKQWLESQRTNSPNKPFS